VLSPLSQWRCRCQAACEAGSTDNMKDFLCPIVADADTGHGGLTAVRSEP
jgi:isocitrate lyase